MKKMLYLKASSSISKSLNTKSFKGVVILIFLTLIFNNWYAPLPEGFQQPWKYRFICISSDIITHIGRFFEYIGVTNRLVLTRIGYHLALGVISIRDPRDSIQITDEKIQNVPIRLFKPTRNAKNGQMQPTIIFYHGGGFFVGSADTFEPAMYRVANNTECLVIYIEYRLIPEFKYPAPLDDCLDATKYLIKKHKDYNIDLNNLVLMGDSAGGNLATVISQHLIENKIAKPKMQVLIYPILQFYDFTLPSYRLNMPKKVLGQISFENFKNFIRYLTGYEVDDSIILNGHTTRSHKESILSEFVNVGYLPNKFRKNHNLESIKFVNDTHEVYKKVSEILLSKELSPLLVEDEHLLKYTPNQTVLITTEMDILRDDGFIYAERLKKLGINVQHDHYNNLFHGVFGLCFGPIKFDGSDILIESISKSIRNFIHS